MRQGEPAAAGGQGKDAGPLAPGGTGDDRYPGHDPPLEVKGNNERTEFPVFQIWKRRAKKMLTDSRRRAIIEVWMSIAPFFAATQGAVPWHCGLSPGAKPVEELTPGWVRSSTRLGVGFTDGFFCCALAASDGEGGRVKTHHAER